VFQSLFYWMSLYNLMPEGIELPLSPAVSILILLDVPLQPQFVYSPLIGAELTLN